MHTGVSRGILEAFLELRDNFTIFNPVTEEFDSCLSETAGATGMKLVKSLGLMKEIPATPHRINSLTEPMISSARVQALRLGEFYQHWYDINSSYWNVESKYRYSLPSTMEQVNVHANRLTIDDMADMIKAGQNIPATGYRIPNPRKLFDDLSYEDKGKVIELHKKGMDLNTATLTVAGHMEDLSGRNFVIDLWYHIPDAERISIWTKGTGTNGRPSEFKMGYAVITGNQYLDLYEQYNESKSPDSRLQLITVHACKNADIFGVFPSFMYRKRKTSKTPVKDAVKYIGNTPHGVFLHKIRDRRALPYSTSITPKVGDPVTAGLLAQYARQDRMRKEVTDFKGDIVRAYPTGYVEKEYTHNEFRIYPALIGVEVIANGQHELWKHMKESAKEVGWENIAYVNTDSICSLERVKYLESRVSDKLGDFKNDYGYGEVLGNGSHFHNSDKTGLIELVLAGIPYADRNTEEKKKKIISGEDFTYHIAQTFKEGYNRDPSGFDDAIGMHEYTSNIKYFRYTEEKDRTLNYIPIGGGYYGLPLQTNQVGDVRPIGNKAYKAIRKGNIGNSKLHNERFPLRDNQ